MEISRKAWRDYITKLQRINVKAANLMEDWIANNGYDDIESMIYWANGLTNKYGNAAAALACEMYDSIAAASGVAVPPAIPAEVMPEEYVAATVRKVYDKAPTTIPNVIERIVKQAGADTTLQNAQRDGAQFAWIPSGDTCAFCITLASRGWRYMSKKALKNGHAEHIHSNCDCQYAIRFGESGGVSGYDESRYKEMYKSAGGDINFMRNALAFNGEDTGRIPKETQEKYMKWKKMNALTAKPTPPKPAISFLTENDLRSVSSNWYDNLTYPEQARTVMFDSYNFTRDPNRAEDTQILQDAISKFELKGNITTWRGVSEEEFVDMFFNFGDSGLKTDEIKGTSIDEARAQAFAKNRGGWMFEYHIGPGKHGAFFDGGVPGSNEGQFVLNKDVGYTIESADMENKKIIIKI